MRRDRYEKTVMIPVKVEAGTIVMLDGARLPPMLNEAIGPCHVGVLSPDSGVAAALSKSGSVKLRGGGTIYATVSANGIPPERRSSARSFDDIARTNSPLDDCDHQPRRQRLGPSIRRREADHGGVTGWLTTPALDHQRRFVPDPPLAQASLVQDGLTHAL